MSEPTKPTQSQFIQTLMQLNAAQVAAKTPEDKDAANHELSLFLRLNAQGRAAEFYASRKVGQ